MMGSSNNSTQTFKMPRDSYMMFKEKNGEGFCYLMISPWDMVGLGTASTDEFWVLGAKFLQNYYSLYNFQTNEVGFVESVTSRIE